CARKGLGDYDVGAYW
nr:immunoglobulin heavy chain junction region [Mus musculus]NSM07209.1 immunoglobulin heavy chain junction region [Mus musculus]NSM08237.1 immunoglobulin heavy chain junction region [Mus musculus]NSM08354.1 immunoglobulin heavy chain junction region [Mus musculus]NSM08467.1 immunoglobulin heavy chain junction region [Mus musculus]